MALAVTRVSRRRARWGRAAHPTELAGCAMRTGDEEVNQAVSMSLLADPASCPDGAVRAAHPTGLVGCAMRTGGEEVNQSLARMKSGASSAVRRVGRAAIRFSPPRSAAIGGLKPTLPLARLELRILQAHRAPSAGTAAAARCFPAALRLAPVRQAGCESPSTVPRLAIAGQLRCTARR